jgi:hypothetical protein
MNVRENAMLRGPRWGEPIKVVKVEDGQHCIFIPLTANNGTLNFS